MIYQNCNGTYMLSSESEVVRNSVALSDVEKFLMGLSDKYDLGEVLFKERNPKNNNSFDSFYIRVSKDLSVDQVFDIGDIIVKDAYEYIEKMGYIDEFMLCGVSVTQRF